MVWFVLIQYASYESNQNQPTTLFRIARIIWHKINVLISMQLLLCSYDSQMCNNFFQAVVLFFIRIDILFDRNNF